MVYALSNLTAFTVLTIAGRELQSDRIESYRGLAKRSPFLAGSLFVALLSLAGVPPLGGFFGKFLILLAAVQNGIPLIALIGLLGVVVSLYYYLSVVKVMYFEEPREEGKIPVRYSVKILLIVLLAGIFATGLWQAPLFSLARSAVQSLFHF